jgi:hypothetical protein
MLAAPRIHCFETPRLEDLRPGHQLQLKQATWDSPGLVLLEPSVSMGLCHDPFDWRHMLIFMKGKVARMDAPGEPHKHTCLQAQRPLMRYTIEQNMTT